MIVDDLWFGKNMTDKEVELCDFMEEHKFLFDDMLFKEHSKTYEMAVVTYEDGIKDGELFLPDCLIDFGYECFNVKVDKLGDDLAGYYDHSVQTIAIDSDYFNDFNILHEMIHLHEDVLLDLSPYYRDVVFFELYKSLKERIPALDEIIETHGHLIVMDRGFEGLHSILFLLKSFEIDMHYSWKLGTTFGYGQADIYGEYSYK